ncbi:MAG: hypothetical protein IKY61_02740, partial [Thermoguttaceae bacterium]|nr:hypothetical protein [Thermoguttaceae bacterium]
MTFDDALYATLTWTADADATPATAYEVAIIDENGECQVVATRAADATEWTTDAPLAYASTYAYAVRAANEYGFSDWAILEFATIEAASTVVTTAEDVVNAYDGKISLREAIQYAEAGDTITFADNVATVTLAHGELTINKAITIDGAGDVTVDANAQSRVFNVLAAGTTDAPVAFVGLTITGGNTTDGAGAKVFNGAATFTNVKITGNSAQAGGAVALVRGSATFTNVEITKNTALHNGGGVFVFDGQATFANVTIADNDANNGDGVYLQATSLAASATFYNAIVADGIGLLDANPSDALVPTTNAYNTLSSYTAWTNANVEGVVNYVLNEGDSVFAEGSYALAADSVARDKGDNAYVAETNTTDLAGNARVVGTVDLGAYEIATEAPSTVVTTFEDVVDARDGKISLREAIQYAEAGATITFASDVATITLGGTELTVDKNITIDGGETGVTVDANEQSRVFSVANNTSVEFVGLTITGGYTVFEGGGVFVDGYASATFTNVEITGNEANQGGGVFLLNGASATFTNVEIAENVADFNGGGVSVTGVGVSATFTNAKITGNEANQGGGVFVVNGASAAFAIVEITGNTANQGGAFAVVGGASATFANATIVEADVQTAGSTAIQLLGSTATFYNSIVDAKISSLSATANAYNTLSAFTEWTNANEEG